MNTVEIVNALDSLGNLDEEEELVQDPDRHKNLLKSFGIKENQESLKPRKSIRSEATNDVSVFSLNPGTKVQLHDLITNVKGTISTNVLKEKLTKFEDRNTQLSALLPRITADKVERAAAYEESSNKVSKWDDVVKRNREAEQLSFPLKHEHMQIHTVDEYVQKFKPKTPLEEQIYSLLKGSKFQENPETGLSRAEEEVLRSVSLQEAKRRRAELQRHRALLSYHEARNRRLSKIKSKKHLKIIRKQKEKKFAADFEKLQETDPEKAKEKVIHAQKTRAEERAVLRHRQGSKWAKKRMIIARYNERTKVDLQEQRKLHNDLVQKNVMKIENSDNDDDDDEEDNSELNPLVSPTASFPAVYLPKDNPWLKQQSKSSAVSNNLITDVSKKVSGRQYNRNRNAVLGLEEVSAKKDDESSDDDESDLKLELSELKDRKRLRQMMDSDDVEPEGNAVQEESILNFRAALADLRKEKKKIRADKSVEVRVSDDENDSSHEDEDELEIGLERRKTMEDLDEVLVTENNISSLSQLSKTSIKKRNALQAVKPKKLKQIDSDKVFTLESTKLADVHDGEDSDGSEDKNRMTIQEAFADDDVLADFVAEKRKVVDESKPKVQDLSLPGWGEWAGGNIKPSKRKRKRFSIKPPPAPRRKDSHLGAVIINENKDLHIAKHQVRQLPYGYASFEQYERSIRQPIGKTWNTPSTFKNLTKPKVTTVMGTIIDPMDETDAFDSSKSGDRKRTLQGDGHIRFDDDETTENRHFKRKKGNKKHKK